MHFGSNHFLFVLCGDTLVYRIESILPLEKMCKLHTPFLSGCVTLESIICTWFSTTRLSGPMEEQKSSNFSPLEPFKDIDLPIPGISYLEKIDDAHSYETCMTMF